MLKNRWLIIILSLSLFLNVFFGIQSHLHAVKAENALIYLANMTLMHIHKIIDYTTSKEPDWDSEDFRAPLRHSLESAITYAFAAQNFEIQKNKNYSEIRFYLSDLGWLLYGWLLSGIDWEVKMWEYEYEPGGEINPRQRGDNWVVEIWEFDPLTETEKQKLIDLGTNLANAGFPEQVEENNGENFKNSLKNIFENYP